MSLEGKVAIVTGASSGIGKGIALRLAKEGAWIVALARRENKLVELKQEILDLYPNAHVRIEQADVLNKERLVEICDNVHSEWGKIDILVNNAGLAYATFIRNLRTDLWDNMIDINIKGALYAISAVLTHMRAQNFGHIINISSDADRKVVPTLGVYCATKAFLSLFTECLKRELTDERIPIKVTSISNGCTISTMFSSEKVEDQESHDYLMQPFGKPFDFMSSEDLADVIVYVLNTPPLVNINNILVRPVFQQQ